MSKIERIFNLFSSSQISMLQKVLPKRYQEISETVRIKKWINETDFKTFIPSKGLAVIEDGLFDYPMFQMCFFNNMIANSIYCMSKGYFPVINYIDRFEEKNLWEQFYLQPYAKEIQSNKVEFHCDIKQANVYFPIFPTREEITLYSSIFNRLAVLNKKLKTTLTMK